MVRFGSFAPSMRIGAYGDVYLAGYLRVLDDEVRTDTLMFFNSRKSRIFCHSTAENNWASTRTCVAAAVEKLFQLTGPSRAVEPPQMKHLQKPVCIPSRSGTAEESASAVAAAAAAAAAAAVVVTAAAAAAVAATATQVAGAWCISFYYHYLTQSDSYR